MENETTGEIQSIRNDRKGLCILGVWYLSNFKKIDPSLNKGDKIKLIYDEVKKDNKVFRNIKSIELIKDSNNVKESKINEVVYSQILSYSKDLAIALMENGKPQELDKIVDLMIKEYKKIKESL